MIHIAKLHNADKGTAGRLSAVERERIRLSAEKAVALNRGYLEDGGTVYPRVEDGEIAIYLQPYCTDFYVTGDARGAAGHGMDGNLLDPWDHVTRS